MDVMKAGRFDSGCRSYLLTVISGRNVWASGRDYEGPFELNTSVAKFDPDTCLGLFRRRSSQAHE
jgi:hypothetical protein